MALRVRRLYLGAGNRLSSAPSNAVRFNEGLGVIARLADLVEAHASHY
jgi:hypothetical protein